MTEIYGRLATRIAVGDQVEPLELMTISGQRIGVPAPDRPTHLQFRRFAGCPVCDLHLSTFSRRHGEIDRAGIREIVLFHSSTVALRPYAEDLPFPVVADPEKRLYAQFGVEADSRALRDPRAWRYILQGVLRSLLRVLRGRQAMPPISPDGGSFGLPADFLIGTDGTLLACKYGEHAYDQWSVDDLLELARTNPGDRADGDPRRATGPMNGRTIAPEAGSRAFGLSEIGRILSPLEDPAQAPRQLEDGAPSARLVFDPSYGNALANVRVGDRMVLLTWLDKADRSRLRARPGRDPNRPEVGVFSTRAPNRPNPIGIHHVTISGVDGATLTVEALEAVNGTPILDLKAELPAPASG